MYGYIRVHAPELKVRQQEYYRAVYCGLCRTMGKCTGQCSRMTLSYDMTCFALVRAALTGERFSLRPRRCPVHPLGKRPMAEPSDSLRLCACMSAVLAHHKLRDDRRDERGVKRAAAVLLSPFVGGFRRRALKRGYAEAEAAVAEAMDALCALEAERPPSVDEPASLFGELMALLLAYGLTGREATLARKIGLHMGRWVYILDAADDFAEDRRRGRYNPLACLYGDPALQEIPQSKREGLRVALLNELTELECALNLLDTSDNPDLEEILRNILYLGMPKEVERVLLGGSACGGSEPAHKTDY